MRRVAAASLVLAAGGCGEEEQSSGSQDPAPVAEVDRLLAGIANGGEERDRAARQLSALVEHHDQKLGEATDRQLDQTLARLEADAAPMRGDDEGPVCGSWADTPEYKAIRTTTQQVLDVAQSASASDVASKWQRHPDPYLAAWAVYGSGDKVDATAVKTIAENDQARYILNISGGRIAKLVPEPLTSTEASARAQLAYTLATDTEHLGCAPAEIEFMDKVRTSDGVDYYVFRFRPEAKGEWLAGVTGPWVPNRFKSAPFTASDYKPVGDATPEELYERILKKPAP